MGIICEKNAIVEKWHPPTTFPLLEIKMDKTCLMYRLFHDYHVTMHKIKKKRTLRNPWFIIYGTPLKKWCKLYWFGLHHCDEMLSIDWLLITIKDFVTFYTWWNCQLIHFEVLSWENSESSGIFEQMVKTQSFQ